VVSAHATELLPEQALVPALNAVNVRDRVTVSAALDRVLERLGRPKRIGLVLADPVAKVSLVKLQQVPARAQDLDQVIRWQVKKTAPFSIDDEVGYVADAPTMARSSSSRWRDAMSSRSTRGCAVPPAPTRASSTSRRSTS
jgi:hypothetical protein